jgi:Flp pilus assembly protein TadB
VVALIAGMLIMLAFRALFRKSKSDEMRRRIQPHVGQEPEKVKRKRERPGLMRGLFASTEHVLGKSKQWSSLSRLLERGDVPLKTVEFAYVILGCGLLLGFMFSVFGLHGIFLLGGFALGAAAPIGWVWRKGKKRLNAFDEQLPDLLMTVAASLTASSRASRLWSRRRRSRRRRNSSVSSPRRSSAGRSRLLSPTWPRGSARRTSPSSSPR